MGKYSLENYEQYQTNIIRPKLVNTTDETKQRATITLVEVAWKTIEKARGVYSLSLLEQRLTESHQSVLVLNLDKPEWVEEHEREYAATFIRRIGSYLDGVPFLHGVVIKTITESLEEWRAYADAFTTTTLYIDLQRDQQLDYFLAHSINIGLIVKASETSYIECCEQFAKHKLNYFWRYHPILLVVEDEYMGPLLQKEARRWHVSYSNKQDMLGYHFELRRLTFPTKAGVAGHLPLRFWFVNIGSAKVYQPYQLRLKLIQGETDYQFNLQAETSKWLTGDIVHNELLKLPMMKTGTYKLYVGLFFKDDSFIPLNIENEENQGYYELGELKLEHWEEDRFRHIWQLYYPEGYYPLEDPALPTEE